MVQPGEAQSSAMGVSTVVALAGFIIMLVIHTGALFYWGGSISRAIRDHDRRIKDLEEVDRGLLGKIWQRLDDISDFVK